MIGFDLENMCKNLGQPIPEGCELVLQDVMTLHGSQFRKAAVIVASPPCQEYSYMAMPWTRAKKIAQEYRNGMRDAKKLTALFDACFRIAGEAGVPLIVENVKGAVAWVSQPVKAHYGSYYLWGDVPAIMPFRNGGGRRLPSNTGSDAEGGTGVKNVGRGTWFAIGSPGQTQTKGNPVNGIKQHGSGAEWFDNGLTKFGSRSDARKAASAQIARIPFPLAQWIARCFKPAR